jgi:hypothetical protein
MKLGHHKRSQRLSYTTRFFNTRQVVRTNKQNVLNASCLEVVKNLQPVLSRLCFARIEAQNVPFTFHINANEHINGDRLHLPPAPNLVADAVKINNRPSGQHPIASGLHFRQHAVRYLAHLCLRQIRTVQLLQVESVQQTVSFQSFYLENQLLRYFKTQFRKDSPRTPKHPRSA